MIDRDSPNTRALNDQALADFIVERCSSRDEEMNGCHLDGIMLAFLREIGFEQSAKAFENVECWRA